MYEYLGMSFDLTNAPTTFNRLIDRTFRKYHSFTGIFFDDIVVYSKTLEEHTAKVFEELKSHKFYVNSNKSEFFINEI